MLIWVFHRKIHCRDIGLPLSYRVSGIYTGKHEETPYFIKGKFCKNVMWGTHTAI